MPEPKPAAETKSPKIKLQFHKRLVTPLGVVYEQGEPVELTADEIVASGLEKRHTTSHCAVLKGEFPDDEDE